MNSLWQKGKRLAMLVGRTTKRKGMKKVDMVRGRKMLKMLGGMQGGISEFVHPSFLTGYGKDMSDMCFT